MNKFFWMILSTFAFSGLSSISLANESYVCLHGASERKITVSYLDSTTKVPCEVIYEKADSVQTLWSADNEMGYCETKAEEFVAKQQGWGWDCVKMTDTSAQ